MAEIVKVRVFRRGPQGAIDPADRQRFDAAVETNENLTAVRTEMEGARQQSVNAAAAADADAQATEAGRQQAVAAAATTTADRVQTGLDRAASETAAGQASNVGNVAAVLPDGFLNGLQSWTSQRGGSPLSTLPTDKMSVLASDALFGPTVQWSPTVAGDNILTKGVVPWGRNAWKVTATLRVTSPITGTLPLDLYAIGLDKDHGNPLPTSILAFNAPADGTEVTVSAIVSPFADDGADKSIVPPSSFAAKSRVRFGVRAGAAGTVIPAKISVTDATQELAQKRIGFGGLAFLSRSAAVSAFIPAPVARISVLHDGEVLSYTRKPAAMATSNIPLATAGAQYWVPKGEATLRHWGAVADAGGLDTDVWTGSSCRLELQSMIGWATANDIRRVVINEGKFLVDKNVLSGSTCVFNAIKLEVIGRGMFASQIYFRDKGLAPEIKKGLFYRTTTAKAEYIRLADFSIISDWGIGGQWAESGQTVVLGDVGGTLHLERFCIKNAANMAVVASTYDRIRVTGCVIDTTSRDGLHIPNSDDVIISETMFLRVCDDSVACVRHRAGSMRENTIVTNCIFIDSQGVYGIGSRNMRVSGNIFVRPTVRAIRLGMMRADNIGTGNPESGNIARYNTEVDNNTFIDGFGRSRWGGTGETGYLITISDSYGTGESPTYEPEYALDPVDGTHYVWGPNGSGGIVAPDAYWTSDGNFIGSVNFSMRGNKCLRTLRPTAKYSDYGHGPRYISGAAPYDGDVIESDFMRDHFWIGGTFRNAIFAENLSVGARNPWRIWGFNNNAAPDFVNMLFKDNIVSDFSGAAAYDVDGFGLLEFEGGIVDGDPLHRHTLRGANGTWTAGSGADAFRVGNAHVRVKGGHYKHLAGLINQVSGKVSFFSPVTISGDIAGLGDNAANKGVRNIPANVPFDYVRTISDPADPAFGRITGMTERYASAMPTSGHYIAGQLVQAPNPIPSGGSIVYGWSRLTTGSTHIAGTDWRVVTLGAA